MAKNEELLLAALKKNNVDAFETLYRKYYDDLYVYLLRFTFDKEKVEDIVQDTFVKLWQKRMDINVKTSLKRYLLKISYNKLIDTYRADLKNNKMLLSYSYTLKMHAIGYGENHMEARLKKLDTCISSLPPKCKEAFISNKILGKKLKEVALDNGISVKTVESHVTRANKILRNCMISGSAVGQH